MKITDILNEENVQVNLAGTTKEEILNAMIDLAAHSGHVTDVERMRAAIFDREKIMSTGVGSGFAIPHGKTDAVSNIVAAFATTGQEIEAEGGFLELAFAATDSLTLYAGYSFDDPEDDDLDPHQRSKNEIPYAAARWRFGSLRLGLEVLDWSTEYVGLDDGDALRSVAWIAYYF